MNWYGPRGNCGCCGAGCNCFTAGEIPSLDETGSVAATEVVFTLTNCDANIDVWYSTRPTPLDRFFHQLQVNSFNDIEGTYSFPIVESQFFGSTFCFPTPNSPWIKTVIDFQEVYQLDFGNRSCFVTTFNDDGLGCPGGVGTSTFVTVGVALEYVSSALGATSPSPHEMWVRYTLPGISFRRRFASFYELPFDKRTDENQCGTSNIRYYDTTFSLSCAVSATTTGDGSTAETVV